MKRTRDEGNEVEWIEYNHYTIVVVEYADDDYPAYCKSYCVDIYADKEMVYEGDESFEYPSQAINAGMQIINDYETNDEPPVTDWYDYYGVNRGDFR